MVVQQQLTSSNRELLEAQGFEVAELTGFDQHFLPLYTHRRLNDKQPGDIVLRARVGNPDSLDDGEASYLARKAYHGLFPWPPGNECTRRTFFDVTVTGGPAGGGGRVVKGAKGNGCKWCRRDAQHKTPANSVDISGDDGSVPKSRKRRRAAPFLTGISRAARH